ncbi:hypothetical protein OA93_23685 [Flavobacterium sp. KMS]|nr:hypothetical protein OA93_23685 [Flavobacterium sp. KMS]
MFLFFIYLGEINRRVLKAENPFNLWLDLTAEFTKVYAKFAKQVQYKALRTLRFYKTIHVKNFAPFAVKILS